MVASISIHSNSYILHIEKRLSMIWIVSFYVQYLIFFHTKLDIDMRIENVSRETFLSELRLTYNIWC